MVKLAKLHLVENFILAKQEHNAIQQDHIDMIDIFEIFDKYHWGKLSFDLTIKSFKKAPFAKAKDGVYCLSGCTYALQVWAYETIHFMDMHATRIGMKIPRLVNWESKAQPKWEEINVNIF